MGFSLEVGALFAGVALASLPYAQRNEHALKPLRGFFLLLFFIKLGGGMTRRHAGGAYAGFGVVWVWRCL